MAAIGGGAAVVGVGPVMAGHTDAGAPCYFFEVARADGSTERWDTAKRRRGLDRGAKMTAINTRMRMVICLRALGAVVLIHDDLSFRSLSRVLSSAARMQPADARAAA